MVEQPLGLVKVRWLAGPVLVMGLELDRPFAGALAGDETWKPGGPDVGVVSSLRHDTAPWGGIAVVGL